MRFFPSAGLEWSVNLISESFIDEDSIPRTGPAFAAYCRGVELYMDALKRIENGGPESVRRVQDVRLRRLLKATLSVPWWCERFAQAGVDIHRIRTTADLPLLPTGDRSLFIGVAPDRLSSAPIIEGEVIWGRTSGSTTGTPFSWAMPRRIWRIGLLGRHMLDMEQYGFDFVRDSKRAFCLTFNYSGTPGHLQHFLLESFSVSHDDPRLDEKLSALSARISEAGPCVIRCTPMELVFLVQKLKELGLHPPIRYCSVTGQSLDEEVRRFTEEYLAAHIRPIYGAQEIGGLGLGCPEDPSRYHLWSERVVTEILDDEGAPVSPGEFGNVVFTPLDNRLMPLVRYRIGDRARLVPGHECRCRYKAGDVLELEGREEDGLVNPLGVRISLKELAHPFKREPYIATVQRFQVRQETPRSIRILLETSSSLPQDLLEKTRKNLEKYASVDVTIELTPFIPQEGKKFKPFVSLPKSTS